MPIIVSRVAAGMPADTCMPRLNEGDQVLYINGRDVTQHKHEQVGVCDRSIGYMMGEPEGDLPIYNYFIYFPI